MFYGASSFNQPLSFDTSSVTNMQVRSVGGGVYACAWLGMARLVRCSLAEGVGCVFLLIDVGVCRLYRDAR